MQVEVPQGEVPSLPVGPPLPDVLAGQRLEVCARRGMLGLVTAAAVFNSLAAPIVAMLERPYSARTGLGPTELMLIFVPMMAGVLCGQIGAMACWLVWGPAPFLRRLAVHWGLAGVMGLCLLGGVLLTGGEFDYPWQLRALFEGAVQVACVLPAVSLAVQVPLWPFRTHLGWRVARLDDEGESSRQALSILDILVGTAIVAVSLGLIRFLSRGDQNPVQHLIMLQMLVAGLGLTVTSLVLLIPAMILLLRTRSFSAGAGIYFGSVLLSVGGLMVVPGMFSNRWPPVEGVFVMLWGTVVFAAAVAAPLFVWRACGYRLAWSRE